MKIFLVFGMVATVVFFSCHQTAKISSADPSLKPRVKPQSIVPVETSTESKNLFIDVHDFGPGKVTYADVMAAHQKDLATEGKYGVNIIKFWFDEEKGKVYCLASA